MRKALLGASAFFLVALGVPSVAFGQQSTPTATVDKTSTTIGDRVLVQGENWAPRTTVHIELCGNSAVDLSADCDLPGASDAGVGQNGHFSMLLTIGRPPSDCPCVVRVTDPSAAGEARVAIAVAGVPNSGQPATPLPDISKMLKVTQVKVTGGNSIASWFGAGSKRTLEFAVANVSTTPVHDPPLSITFGKGNDPTGIIVAPHIGDLNPGDVHIMKIPIDVDTLSLGGYTVKGQIAGLGQPLVFRGHTSTYPWGLFVLALLVVQGLLLLIRNRVRRRLYSDEELDAQSVTEAPVVAGAVAAAAVVPTVQQPVVDIVDDPVTAPVARLETVDLPPVVPPVGGASVDAAGERVTELARSLHLTTDALLSAVVQRSDDMQHARDTIDADAAAALERLVADANSHRSVVNVRRNHARLDLDRAAGQSLEILDIAEGKARKLITDAEQRARLLIERAHADASALLLPATPEAFDGVVPAPVEQPEPIIDLADEPADTPTPPQQ